MFIWVKGLIAHLGKGPHRGTLTPLVPLSLRAIKGEGEGKTEACTCALAQVHASVWYWGSGERMDSGSGAE